MNDPPQLPIDLANDAVFSPGRDWVAGKMLASDPKVRHATTTRRMSRTPSDRVDLVRRLRREAGWETRTIVLAEQVHGAETAVVRQAETVPAAPDEAQVRPDVDALVTDVPGITLAVFTADCVPILFADAEAGVIGAVHAGWRGTLARILPGALKAAFELGASAEGTRLWIGPAISVEAYEVSLELAEQFARAFPQTADRAVRGRHVDLSEINRAQALDAGLAPDRVALCGLCTHRCRDDFFSYRAEGEDAGRMASAICLGRD
jgi:YfiH family protein